MTQFTKRMLADALITLLEEKPLDRITIKELTENCGVNRNTFYYHFQDIYSLLNWIFMEEAERIIAAHRDRGEWLEGIKSAMDYVFQNKKMIYHVYYSIRREELERYLYEVMENVVLDYVAYLSEGMEISGDDRRLIADFFKYALVGWALHWIENGMTEEPGEAASKLDRIFSGTLKQALENSENKK